MIVTCRFCLPLGVLLALIGSADVSAQSAGDAEWSRVTEDDRAISIETDKLEAVIPRKNPKQWMTGIEKGSFLDKTTAAHIVGCFDTIAEMHTVYDRYKGHTALTADASGWHLVK